MVGLDPERDPHGRVDLQDAIHNRPGVVARIGLGLRALYNFALMERLPPSFAKMLPKLESAENANAPETTLSELEAGCSDRDRSAPGPKGSTDAIP